MFCKQTEQKSFFNIFFYKYTGKSGYSFKINTLLYTSFHTKEKYAF